MYGKFIIALGLLGSLMLAAPALADEQGSDLGARAEIRASIVDRIRAIRPIQTGVTTQVSGHLVGGVVTSVDGLTFVIDPFGNKPTTTITTDSATVFDSRGATTSAAVAVGSKVLVFGSTTATSTNGDTFAAALVKILGDGWGHLRVWLHWR